MAYITLNTLTSALSTFLDNLTTWLPFAKGGKSLMSTLSATNDGESAFGYHNESESDTIFSIGNGTEDKKSNAFEVKKDGGVYIIKEGERVKLQDMAGSGIEVESIPLDKITGLN